jgi:ribosomal protein S17E
MKLGVSYNVFDGEELLEGSIKSIRNSVDYISVVYQKTSNFGNPCSDNLVNILNDLINKKLVDSIVEYETKNVPPHQNELNKRNLGLFLSKNNNCTHHMSMDSDEFYVESQLNYLKNIIESKDYDSSFCKMVSYYKTGDYIRDPKEEYYVPVIYKIKNNEFTYAEKCVVEVDPTRRIKSQNPVILERNDIEMHHYSMVRTDIKSKFINSTSRSLFNQHINKMIDDYNNWEYPNKVLWPGNPPYYVEIKKVKNLFYD